MTAPCLFLVIGLLVSSVGLTLLLLQRGRRLRHVTELLQRASGGQWAVRIPTRGTNEISKLAGAINRLLAHVTELEVRQIEAHREAEFLQTSHRELKRSVSEISLLHAVASALDPHVELPDLLSRICNILLERLDLARVSIVLRSPEGPLELTRPLSPEGVCPPSSTVAVPMVYDDMQLGVLSFSSSRGDVSSHGEIALFHAVANQAAHTLQNALSHRKPLAPLTSARSGVSAQKHLFESLDKELSRIHRFGN